ncbi:MULTISPECIES: hypothetical protein [Acinetobacter]|uniref:hypothetical protein n=1 Tax=Acinetobacter TaxID=469 RepID=UPI001022EAFB|nr:MULTISPECIES: hypothetical protein [Acinetobacter]MDF2419160.1 hypothetical protein [Acinetobacter beijerinckii]RZG79306.1 hypothetical protein EXE23_14100 [Acinetobacter venetianus]
MPTRQIVTLNDQELEIIEEARVELGLNNIQETLEFLIRQRLQEKLLTLAGREIVKKKRHL